MSTGTVTIVVETFNLAEGQSFAGLESALRVAADAVRTVDGVTIDAVLVVDPSGDPRVASSVRRLVPSALLVTMPSGVGYDDCKNRAAELATTDHVLYLDGDCRPIAGSRRWMSALIRTLEAVDAPGAAGITVYEGRGALNLAMSVLDFGFLADAERSAGRVLGCYASNNVLFRRAARTEVPSPVGALRCSCYSHAQTFLRLGSPLVLASDPDARALHERPPVLAERWRRGGDAVRAAELDPQCFEAGFFHPGANRLMSALRFGRASARFDRARFSMVAEWAGASRAVRLRARLLMPPLRLIDLAAQLAVRRTG